MSADIGVQRPWELNLTLTTKTSWPVYGMPMD